MKGGLFIRKFIYGNKKYDNSHWSQLNDAKVYNQIINVFIGQ